jgi:hypothetical protein
MLTNVFFFDFKNFKIQEKTSPIQEINFFIFLVAPENYSIAFFFIFSGATRTLIPTYILVKKC